MSENFALNTKEVLLMFYPLIVRVRGLNIRTHAISFFRRHRNGNETDQVISEGLFKRAKASEVIVSIKTEITLQYIVKESRGEYIVCARFCAIWGILTPIDTLIIESDQRKG